MGTRGAEGWDLDQDAVLRSESNFFHHLYPVDLPLPDECVGIIRSYAINPIQMMDDDSSPPSPSFWRHYACVLGLRAPPLPGGGEVVVRRNRRRICKKCFASVDTQKHVLKQEFICHRCFLLPEYRLVHIRDAARAYSLSPKLIISSVPTCFTLLTLKSVENLVGDVNSVVSGRRLLHDPAGTRFRKRERGFSDSDVLFCTKCFQLASRRCISGKCGLCCENPTCPRHSLL